MTIISENYKFIFIHIPKCGGSSIEIEFEKFAKWGDFIIGSTEYGYELEKVFAQLYGIDKHSAPEKLIPLLGDKWSEYTKMAIIRHPRKIIESYYKFGKRREREIIKNRLLTRADLLDDINGGRKIIPHWMFNQTNGVMIDAILSKDFDDYLRRVADDRWEFFFNRYVFDHGIDQIFKLEDALIIRHYMQNIIDDSFELRHENISKSEKLVWSEDNYQIYKNLIGKLCNKLGYGLDYD